MSIYQRFCNEVIGEGGELKSFTLDYPANFNFGYDVVDAIADEEPDKRALVWLNAQNAERIFSFSEMYGNLCNSLFRTGFHFIAYGFGLQIDFTYFCSQ